jgi:hypothetical protein
MQLCDKHGYSAGDELIDVISCKSMSVGNDGCITAWITDGEPVVLFGKSALEGSTLCGVTGESNVVLTSQAIISTTWTSVVDGQPSVFHAASTVPWDQAPSSITATATGYSGSTAKATSAASVSAPQPQSISSLLSLAIIPTMLLAGSLVLSMDRFFR